MSSTQVETVAKTTKEWLIRQGYLDESDVYENIPLILDSFAYFAFIVQLEDRLGITIRTDLFFKQDSVDQEETFKSLCQRLERSIL